MTDPQPSREPFRIVTPHREGCKGEWRFAILDRAPTEVRCYCATDGHNTCPALAYMPESAIGALVGIAELRAEVADWKLKAEDEFLKRSATEAEVLRMTAIASHLANGVSRRLKGITTDLALLYLLDDPDVRALLDTDTAGGQ